MVYGKTRKTNIVGVSVVLASNATIMGNTLFKRSICWVTDIY